MLPGTQAAARALCRELTACYSSSQCWAPAELITCGSAPACRTRALNVTTPGVPSSGPGHHCSAGVGGTAAKGTWGRAGSLVPGRCPSRTDAESWAVERRVGEGGVSPTVRGSHGDRTPPAAPRSDVTTCQRPLYVAVPSRGTKPWERDTGGHPELGGWGTRAGRTSRRQPPGLGWVPNSKASVPTCDRKGQKHRKGHVEAGAEAAGTLPQARDTDSHRPLTLGFGPAGLRIHHQNLSTRPHRARQPVSERSGTAGACWWEAASRWGDLGWVG